MHRRLEGIHAERKVKQGADRRQAKIDVQHALGDINRARQGLAEGVKPLRAEKLHAADAHHRQEHQRHDHDPKPAQPLQDAPPQQDALGQIIKPLKNRCSGCGQPGHRFEIGIDKAKPGLAKHERDRPEKRQHRPDQRGQQKRLLNGKPLIHRVFARKRHKPANQAGDDKAFGKHRPMLAPLGDIHQERQRHGKPHGHDHQANKISHGTHIKHDAQSWALGAVLSSGMRGFGRWFSPTRYPRTRRPGYPCAQAPSRPARYRSARTSRPGWQAFAADKIGIHPGRMFGQKQIQVAPPRSGWKSGVKVLVDHLEPLSSDQKTGSSLRLI